MYDRSLNNVLTVVFRLTNDDYSIIQNMKNEFLYNFTCTVLKCKLYNITNIYQIFNWPA